MTSSLVSTGKIGGEHPYKDLEVEMDKLLQSSTIS